MYFINGTMEEILDNLSRIEDLKVISRTTVEQYRENRKTVPVIAEELNVGYVLEGSGQRDGNQVRITLQLLDKGDRHIWTESYVREIENIFDLQKEVARLVAREVERAISEEAINRKSELSENSIIAKAIFEKGMEILEQYWEDTDNLGILETAEVLFRFALEYDTTHSQTYRQLAYAYNTRYNRNVAKGGLDSALLMLNKAIQYEPQNAELHSFKGAILARKGKSDEAMAAFEMALSIDPEDQQSLMGILDHYRGEGEYIKALETYNNYIAKGSESAAAQKSLAWLIRDLGFKDVGRQLVENAFQLDGDTADYYYRLARLELGSGNTEGAIEFFLTAETMNPGNYLDLLAISYYWDHQYEQSLIYYKKHIERIGLDGSPFFARWAGYVFIQNGETSQGERYIQMDIERIQQNLETGIFLSSSYREMAEILAFRGEKQEALNHLREFVKQEGIKGIDLILLDSPMFDKLRDEPDFQEILEEATAKAQVYHNEIGQWLEENDML
jgi:TolB-like protein